jgi:hypothetical protein
MYKAFPIGVFPEVVEAHREALRFERAAHLCE